MPRISYQSINAAAVASIDKVGGPLRRLAEVVSGIMLGKMNVGGTVTLTGPSTTLVDSRIGVQSLILFMATDEAAASIMSSLFVSSRGNGTAQLGHVFVTGVTFEYVVIG